ncbi:MAG: NAD(P)H-binding protein [Deltaproteobacteria bacterium]|nr:NAD(P)H-binding protein [Deltaproteobacteria bacterium]
MTSTKDTRRVIVTGAFTNIGAAVARVLLERGRQVHTLTGRCPADPATPITRAPLHFERLHLVRELEGADALVNTYWIRLPMAGRSFEGAVANSRLLFDAAREAGVGRVVHISVCNAPEGRNLAYYRGKADVEDILRDTGLPHTILRPTLVVSHRDVLTNNIVWLLRRFPVFLLPGCGRARLQPILLDETARIIADAVDETGSRVADLAGPEAYTFREWVALLAESAKLRRLLIPAPSSLALLAVSLLGLLLSDVILSRQELQGLQQELLLSSEPPAGKASVRAWLLESGHSLGRRYMNDRRRHFGADRHKPLG